MGDLGDRLEVDHHAARVGEILDEDGAAFRREGAAEILGLGGIDEAHVPIEFLEAAAELRDRAAVELVGRQKLGARLHEQKEREQLRRVTGGAGDGAAPALEACDALLEDRHRGVGQARVDVAVGLQVEERGRVVDVVEHVGRILINRRDPGARGGIGRGARVDRKGLEAGTVRSISHGAPLL